MAPIVYDPEALPSAVINNPNLLERLLKLHGRWNSDTARDMYVWENVFKRLQISSRIGL